MLLKGSWFIFLGQTGHKGQRGAFRDEVLPSCAWVASVPTCLRLPVCEEPRPRHTACPLSLSASGPLQPPLWLHPLEVGDGFSLEGGSSWVGMGSVPMELPGFPAVTEPRLRLPSAPGATAACA